MVNPSCSSSSVVGVLSRSIMEVKSVMSLEPIGFVTHRLRGRREDFSCDLMVAHEIRLCLHPAIAGAPCAVVTPPKGLARRFLPRPVSEKHDDYNTCFHV